MISGAPGATACPGSAWSGWDSGPPAPASRRSAAFQGAQLLFIALIMHQALRGRAADLAEGRRRFRVVLVIGAAGYSLFVVLLEMALRGPIFAAPVSAGNAAGLLAFSLALTLAELSLSERGGLVPQPAPRRVAPADLPERTAQEAALLDRLRRVMESEKAYRQEGFAIAGLAARLAVPQYRLRRLINQRLGHRNFSSFVNGDRLADARAALADPEQAEVPIVTIALDAGFQSLGPFNRAFKAETGMTPTDYRRQGTIDRFSLGEKRLLGRCVRWGRP